MFMLRRSFILEPKTADVVITEILLDYKGKQEGIKRIVRKLDDIPKIVVEHTELLIHLLHYEIKEICDSSIKEIFDTEHKYELYLDKQIYENQYN